MVTNGRKIYQNKINLCQIVFITLHADEMRAKFEFSHKRPLIREHTQLKGILTSLSFTFEVVL